MADRRTGWRGTVGETMSIARYGSRRQRTTSSAGRSRLAGCTATVLLSVVGCAGSPSDGAGEAGPRLQAVYAAAGEARVFVTFIDTRLNTPCTVPGLTSGRAQCRPPFAQLVFPGDCALETNVAPHILASDGADDVFVTMGYFADAPTEVVRRGRRVEPYPARLGFRYNDICIEPQQGQQVYEIAERWPLDALAAGEVRAVPVADRLEALVFDGDDGGHALVGFRDTLLDKPCDPVKTERHGTRCVANIWRTVKDDGLRDETCSRLAIVDYSIDDVVRVETPDGPVLYRPVDAASNRVARLDVQGRCVATTVDVPAKKRLFFAAPFYPIAEWPTFTLVRRGSRLSVEGLVLEGPLAGLTDTLTPALLDDTLEQTVCKPMILDGALRCAPTRRDSGWYVHFHDPQCQRPSLYLSPGERPPPAFAVPGDSGSRAIAAGVVHAVGPVAQVSTFYRRLPTGCAPHRVSSHAAPLLELLPGDRFPSLMREQK